MTTSLARRPETAGGSHQAVPAGPAAAGYLLPATWPSTATQAGAALGMPIRPWVALSPFFILLPSLYPPPAASRAPARVVTVTASGRSGPRRAREGEMSP